MPPRTNSIRKSVSLPQHAVQESACAEVHAELSEKELLLKITRERGLSGETVAGIVGVIQHGVELQHEK